MKKMIAMLLIGLLLAVSGCAADTGESEMTTEASTVAVEPTEETVLEQETTDETAETEIIWVDKIPETESESVEDLVFEDIVPFGNVPGRIASTDGNENFVGWEDDTRYKRIIFNTDKLELQIHYDFGEPVYVVDGYIEKLQALYDTTEAITGMTFHGRIVKETMDEYLVFILLKNAFVPGAHEDCDTGSTGVFPTNRNLSISQSDALLGKSVDPLAGLATILMTDTAYHRFNDIYDSGFSVYTAYKVQKYLEAHDPQLAMVSRDSAEILMNYHIHDGLQTLKEKNMDYWMNHPDSLWNEIVGNGPASVGFYFMMYLDEVYGDYCGWVSAYGENYPCRYANNTSHMEEQIQVMKDVYGEEVFDRFYPWLEEKLNSSFAFDPDYSWRKQYVYYPLFAGYGYEPRMFDGKYEDMCVSLAEYRNYMTEFKGYDLEGLTLVNSRPVTVALYDRDGRFITATWGTRISQYEYQIDLRDVYYIRFVDTGKVCAELRLSP